MNGVKPPTQSGSGSSSAPTATAQVASETDSESESESESEGEEQELAQWEQGEYFDLVLAQIESQLEEADAEDEMLLAEVATYMSALDGPAIDAIEMYMG